jgi:putative methyltransferase (TIGR04325 family)
LLKFLKQRLPRYGFFGNYASWEEAKKASGGGYDSELILNKVRDSLLKVNRGEAVYERDSVLFDEVQYSWPLLSGLLWIASLNGNKLNLVDLGGSLGSTFYQNRKFLSHLPELQWSIVEQQNFVECGKQHFETDQLKFYRTLDECVITRHPDTILLCSVIPYLEKPYELLQEVVANAFSYIILDRTYFLVSEADRLTVQKVPPQIYTASYPAWFLNREKFLRLLEPTYELVAEFEALAGEISLENTSAYEKGFIFRKRISLHGDELEEKGLKDV